MSRHLTQATIDDATHLSSARHKELLTQYPEHERAARLRGVPQFGSGLVFQIDEDRIAEDAFVVPEFWPVLGALDFGYDHPTAAVKLAWDRDADCVHVVQAYRVREQTPVIHTAALKPLGADLPFAWPQDGHQRESQSGEATALAYKRHGLKMLAQHAQFEGKRGNGLEAGLSEMLERMLTGRLKVFRHLAVWWEEFRMYHRNEGLVVKEHDDVMSATRYGLMSLRYARVPAAKRGHTNAITTYDHFGGR